MSAVATDTTDLLIKYKETGDLLLRNELVLKYGGLVKAISLSTRNLYYKYAEVDDVVNEGIISLISAIETFDFDKNVKFETYATLKIRGAIIDFIRKQDFIPRSVRKFARELDSVYSRLYQELSREPTTDELAENMGISTDKFRKMMGDVSSATTLSFEELLYENNFDIADKGTQTEIPGDSLYRGELTDMLADAIDCLKDKERAVVSLYYYEKLKFSDIAKVIQVSESRVSQIHSKAMIKLKSNLSEYILNK